MHREQFLFFTNGVYIEHLYSQYLKNRESLSPSWRYFFEGMEFGSVSKQSFSSKKALLPFKVLRLIEAYRRFGYQEAHSNPLRLISKRQLEQLQIKSLGFRKEELETVVPTYGLLKEARVPLTAIIDRLKTIYCKTVGIEYTELQSQTVKEFIQSVVERPFDPTLSQEEKIEILRALNDAEMLERFLHRKYPGQKRFSLEGGETLIPMLRKLIQAGSLMGIEEIILGMAHRGRLNVLVNVLGKSEQALFEEFEKGALPQEDAGSGDVKYHQGYCTDLSTSSGKQMKLVLCPNPSHLEAVNGVLEGYARARQKVKGKVAPILPVLIHGDAAFAGQGVVYETFQLAKLEGYQTGGTIHIILNNQLGFTASKQETQSTPQCTDLGKAFGIPIFHLNGEDPEKSVQIMELALDIRQRFGCDVLIELNCYRRHGHNESDEPTFTNPKMYQEIQKRESVRTLYLKMLIENGILSEKEATTFESTVKKRFTNPPNVKSVQKTEKAPLALPHLETTIPLETLLFLGQRCATIPEKVKAHPKLKKLFENRLKMISGNPSEATIDWGMGESLTYATLLTEGVHVRLSGQDSARGTFSHRHALIVDQETEKRDSPLFHLKEGQASFEVYNSPLSEYAVMGFEYGYSIAYPKGLIIWEGQFGDFANGAQIIIDQFLVSGKEKWNAEACLTLLLPHGYEGQGPEHSSARLERFLQLAGNESIRIAIPTTPAQLFHILRNQGLSNMRRPLILLTPKGLLRYSQSFSSLNAFANGHFQTVIDDLSSPEGVWRVIFCSGKVYYDLKARKKNEGIALIRIEQLYPLDIKALQNVIKRYPSTSEWIWAQEEPENMGAYSFIRPFLENLLPEKHALRYVGRKRSASPAAGSETLHLKELETFLKKALDT